MDGRVTVLYVMIFSSPLDFCFHTLIIVACVCLPTYLPASPVNSFAGWLARRLFLWGLWGGGRRYDARKFVQSTHLFPPGHEAVEAYLNRLDS